jgi:hypothetical protein
MGSERLDPQLLRNCYAKSLAAKVALRSIAEYVPSKDCLAQVFFMLFDAPTEQAYLAELRASLDSPSTPKP